MRPYLVEVRTRSGRSDHSCLSLPNSRPGLRADRRPTVRRIEGESRLLCRGSPDLELVIGETNRERAVGRCFGEDSAEVGLELRYSVAKQVGCGGRE